MFLMVIFGGLPYFGVDGNRKWIGTGSALLVVIALALLGWSVYGDAITD
jgi:hypothetical protein